MRLQGRAGDKDPLISAVAQSLYPGQGGEIFVVPAEYFVVDEAAPKAHGTSHGSPWDYDRLVSYCDVGQRSWPQAYRPRGEHRTSRANPRRDATDRAPD